MLKQGRICDYSNFKQIESSCNPTHTSSQGIQTMEEEEQALRVLATRCFDRSPADVQQLAAWLGAHCHPFFSSMRQDVLEHLCTFAGHAWVEASEPVYSQDDLSECMYVIVKGSCCVLKRTSSSRAAATAAGGPTAPSYACTSASDPGSHASSRSSTVSQPVSRRATVEIQTQQFALATGSVGTQAGSAVAGVAAATGPAQGSSRRVTAESSWPVAGRPSVLGAAPALGGAAGSRRVSGVVMAAGQQAASTGVSGGSRRVTTEQLVQQQLAESTQLGWLTRGDSFGESALLSPNQRRPVSVVAGVDGAFLLLLDRACFSRLQQQAQEQQPLAVAGVQAVLAAACRPILQVAGRERSAEEVQALAELFSGLEAFRCMPHAVRSRLAKACQGVQLPPGAVVFQEDDKGDAMYVVVSGSLQVRARPLQPSTATSPSNTSQPHQQSGPLAASYSSQAAAAAAALSTARGPPGSLKGHRATTDAVFAVPGPRGGHRGAVAAAGVGRQAGSQAAWAHMSGARRATWGGEGGGWPSTAARGPATGRRSTVEMTQELDGPMLDKAAAPRPGAAVGRDGLFWTSQFMSDATAAVTASDPHWGLEGGMTPLAAVMASKWRQQVRQQAVDRHAQAAAAEEEAADVKAYAAMEEMLGKAAAKAWKAAKDSSKASEGSKQQRPGAAAAKPKPPGVAADTGMTVETSCARASDEPTAANSPLSAAARASDSTSCSSSDIADAAADPAAPTAQQRPADSGPEPQPQAPVPCTPRTAAAAAAQLLAAAAATSDPLEAVKLHLAALGVKDPADVSRSLLAELGSRSTLEGLLGAVAEYLERRGLPHKLNKKNSLKITRELNKRMLAGASWQGYSGGSSASCSFNARQADADSGADAARGWSSQAHHHSKGGHRGADDSELATEATGLSSPDWHSSLDASDAESLCTEGSMLDGIDLPIGSTDGQAVAGTGTMLQGGSASGVHCSCGGAAGCNDCSARLHLQVACAGTGTGAGAVAAAAEGGAGAAFDARCLTARFGGVIRTLSTGDSFGELALLQVNATRTATVVVAPERDPSSSCGSSDGSGGGGSSIPVLPSAEAATAPTAVGAGGALLVKISRACYDATVRGLQVAALEGLLSFLSSLPPFSGLSRELLTSLAVLARPVTAQAGQVLALGGQPVDALVIVQSGDVKLLADSTASAEPPGALRAMTSSSAGSSSSSSPSSSRRTTGTVAAAPATGVLGGQGNLRRTLSKPGASSSNGSSNGSTALTGSGSNGSSGSGSGGTCGVLGQGLHVGLQLTPAQQLRGVQLAVLGPGSLLGENVLGYNPEQDPQAAIASATTRSARAAAVAAAAALRHPATAVAASPVKLLVLPAEDLRRFGRRLRAPLAEAAVARRDWLQLRLAAVQVSHPSNGQLASTSAAQQQRLSGAASSGRLSSSPPTSGVSSGFTDGSGSGLWQLSSSGSRVVAPAAGAGANFIGNSSHHTRTTAWGDGPTSSSSGGSGAGSSGLGPGLMGLLAPQGSCSAAAAAMLQRRMGAGAGAAAASRSQWQQQQWQQQAYGELLQPPQALAAQQQLTVKDVTRLKQLVPAMQGPCVSELAAAARPFPAGMLTASSVAAAGRDAGKGLQLLLSPRQCQPGGLAAGEVGSPKLCVGPGGRLLPAAGVGGPAAVTPFACTIPASGRRGPMERNLLPEASD